MMRTVTMVLLLAGCCLGQQWRVLREIEGKYEEVVSRMAAARSLEDLDKITQWLDTPDWVSVVPGAAPRTWADLRKYGFEALWSKEPVRWKILSFQMDGDTATVDLLMGGRVKVKDSWMKTADGWKRSRHEKFAPAPQ